MFSAPVNLLQASLMAQKWLKRTEPRTISLLNRARNPGFKENVSSGSRNLQQGSRVKKIRTSQEKKRKLKRKKYKNKWKNKASNDFSD